MKIGILTFFDGVNFGGYSQTYALHHRLKELGFDNKVINYKNKHSTIMEYKSLFYTKKPKIFFNNLMKFIYFRIAQKKLDTTVKIKNHTDMKNIDLDIAIVGSDEVWNFENDLFDIDEAYFGLCFDTITLISYAACFGKLSTNNDIPNHLKEGLKKFTNISVRDDNSCNMIKKALGTNPPIVLDPTLLYNFDKEISGIKIKLDEKYILFYGIGFEEYSNNTIKQIKKFASTKNMKIVSVGFYSLWADISIVSLSPFEWMQYIKNASYVITNMFHGTVFSIKFNKQFLTIGSSKRKNKIESLLGHMGILDRILYFRDTDSNTDDIINVFKLNINYNIVNEIIKNNKKQSEDFLINSIRAHETKIQE